MNSAFPFLLLTFLATSTSPVESSASLYHKSYITDTHVEDWGQNFKFEGVMSPSSSLRQVLHKCDVVIPNCKSACQLSNGSWALINISIPADITDNLPGTKLLCLTTAVSLIFPASRKLRSITGTSGKTDGFTAENLAGYFSGDAKKYACFHTFNANSYLLIEFNIVQPVTKVDFLVQRTHILNGKFGSLEVRVGNYSGDFNELRQLGDTYTDTPNLGDVITFEETTPIWSTHILVRELEANKMLYCCGLRVY